MWQALFLDREGVVTPKLKEGEYLLRADQVKLVEDISVLRALAERAIPIFLVTNQSCVSRGLITLDEALRLHGEIVARLKGIGVPVKDSRLCPHAPKDGCDCRKPKPGMIVDLCRTHALHPRQTCSIGDSRSDTEAAIAAGCGRAFWITDTPTAAAAVALPRVTIVRTLGDAIAHSFFHD